MKAAVADGSLNIAKAMMLAKSSFTRWACIKKSVTSTGRSAWANSQPMRAVICNVHGVF